MKQMNQWIRLACAATLALLLGACGDEEPEAETPAAADAAVSADSVYVPRTDSVRLPEARIYYTLTDHEWYARGEPLQHEGAAYEPGGAPLAADLAEMEQAGSYAGVEYYRRADEPDNVLYVPVFPGYWQPFRAAAGRGN